MGEINKEFRGVKLFMAVMFRPKVELGAVLDALTALYGEVELSFGPVEFSWSDYYESEMGGGLLKYYLIFREPVERSHLPQIKHCANGLERQFAENGRRTVNIDPGYLAVDKLVLASTKDFYHRLYLGDGIFGEVTLHYRRGLFRHFSWTYPDYQSPEFLKFLETARTGVARA
jgi:hypothetical protein